MQFKLMPPRSDIQYTPRSQEEMCDASSIFFHGSASSIFFHGSYLKNASYHQFLSS